MRKVLLACIAASLLLMGAPSPTAATVPVLVIEGRGFGHGVGMAQDGAYWMGRAGAVRTATRTAPVARPREVPG